MTYCCSNQATVATTKKEIPCECDCPCEQHLHDQKEKQSFDTTYRVSYTRKPIVKNESQIFKWDQKLDAEESSFVPQQGRYDFPSYYENFSTLYDLSYNHFPRCIGLNQIQRKVGQKMIADEYLPSYGNITKTGLLEGLKESWRCDVQDPRCTSSTEIRDNYVRHPLEAFKFKRYSIIAPDEEAACQAQLLFLKGGPPVPPKPVCWEERGCNPLTWECPWKSF